MATLEIKDLHAQVEGKEILKGVNLTIKQGEVHALMGPNGSGKSTLAYTLLGHPKYKVTSGDILVDGQSILALPPDKRAKAGLFLAFQYPVTVPGVTMFSFLRAAYNSVHTDEKNQPPTLFEFREAMNEKMKLLGVDESFMNRYLNEGFSGGEKKRAEILQLALLKPKFAVLDETDSGLDIDALKTVAEGVSKIAGVGPRGPDNHALPAHPEIHQAHLRPRAVRREDNRLRRRGPLAEAGEGGLRVAEGAGRRRRMKPFIV